jgi:hypothetical protein
MNDDTFNMSMRKFLKKVGITSQREIEQAVADAIEAGDISDSELLPARMVLEIPKLGLRTEIDGDIALE